MKCTPINLGGVTGFACSRATYRACSSCGYQTRDDHGALCDFPLAGKKAGATCSRFCCRRCARSVSEGVDYCPAHSSAAAPSSTVTTSPRTSSSLVVRTARISASITPDRLDVSRKSGGPDGLPFAPSWAILTPAIEARRQVQGLRELALAEEADALLDRSWAAYVEAYTLEMRASYVSQRPAWDALLARESVCLICYCTHWDRCHRTLLAKMLEKLGATLGELR